MSHLEIWLLTVILSLITLTWLVIIAGAFIIAWRMRRLIIGVTIAARGVMEVSRQLADLGRGLNSVGGRRKRE
jgi:hypothetical protein